MKYYEIWRNLCLKIDCHLCLWRSQAKVEVAEEEKEQRNHIDYTTRCQPTGIQDVNQLVYKMSTNWYTRCQPTGIQDVNHLVYKMSTNWYTRCQPTEPTLCRMLEWLQLGFQLLLNMLPCRYHRSGNQKKTLFSSSDKSLMNALSSYSFI